MEAHMSRVATIVAVVWLLLLGVEARAQESASSSILGRVEDSTQGALPGATVSATNVGTGATRTTTTDAEGRFTIPNLPAATYRLRVELDGFAPTEIGQLVLRLGQTASPVVTMQIASFAETVQVEAAAALLETQSASVGQVVDEKQLQVLPTIDRNVLSLASLGAGVSNSINRSGSRANYLTVEGGRDSSTNYAIDGVYVRALRFNYMSLTPPIDSVQEVSLLRNSFSTEYGQGQAVLSMATKSGTNQVSGSVSGYFRNENFNARNYFEDPSEPKAPFRRSVIGTTLGAPIIQNRVFVFGSYEGARTEESNIDFAVVPEPRWLTGDLSSFAQPVIDPQTGRPFPGNVIPPSRFSRMARLMSPLFTAPNRDGIENFGRVGSNKTDADTLTVRFDQVLSENHTLFQRYMWNDRRAVSEGAFNISNPPEGSQNLALGHTWVISPTMVNEFRFGYNFYELWSISEPYNAEWKDRNFLGEMGLGNIEGAVNPLYFGPPGIDIDGYDGSPNWGRGQGATQRDFSFSNATSKTWGRHNLRFGLQAQYRRFYQGTPVGPRGSFTFDGLFTGNPIGDYLLGYCSLCRGQFGTSDSHYRSPTIAPFFDDNWVVNNRLTLQLGLRWEYVSPWYEANYIEGSLDPELGLIGYSKVPDDIPASLRPLIIDRDGHFPRGITKKDLNNWAPRVGAAYSVNDRTVIRSGFGVYYDNLNLNELQFTRLVPPFAGRYDIIPTRNDPVSTDPLFPGLDAVERFPAPFSMNPKNLSAYTVQWNANVQRSLGRAYLVEVAYTGSRTRKEHKRFNINQAFEGTGDITARLPYPQFDPAILTSSNDGYGDFEGLSLRFERRATNGLGFLASYQISRNRDNNSGESEANDTAMAWDKDADYSYSLFHRKHRSTLSATWELPFGPGKPFLAESGPGSAILGGWTIAALARLESGTPVRSITGSNRCRCGSYVPQRVDFAPGREDDKGQLDNPTAEMWYDVTAYVLPPNGFQGRAGRNTVIGPPFRTVDVSIIRQFQVQRLRLDFRAEIYNLLNTVNLNHPERNISNRNAGRITSARDPRTTQLSLRLAW
jgi:hypothetical protein